MQAGSFELSVNVRGQNTSTKIREYGHQGRTFIEGRKGQPFSITFRNHSAERVLAIPSVDGICALDGQPASDTSRGYVVNAYSSLEVKGWRTSLEDVAQFFFETKDGSYATNGPVGDARNCGVIGCTVIAERPRPAYIKHVMIPSPYPVWPVGPCYPSWWLEDHTYCVGGSSAGESKTYTTNTSMLRGAPPTGSEVRATFMSQTPESAGEITSKAVERAATAPDFNLGTGYGQAIQDQVSETTFERGGRLAVLEIFYSDANGLKKAGIDLRKGASVSKANRGFPAAFSGFCAPPVK